MTSESRIYTIRPFMENDWASTWEIIEPVFRTGETYAYSPDITEAEAHRVWIEVPEASYVVTDDDNRLLGTYYIKANQPSQGAHVCNCGYIVSNQARGRGIASQMCEHSQREAIALGFRSMQYNLVVSTNESAIRLWKKHGFEIIGTLPESFHHPRLGFIDAFVMYKILEKNL